MGRQLLTAPVEVVELVAASLELTDLFSLRLVCSELNWKTLHYFGRTYFSALRTNLTSQSLQKLHDISEKKHFKDHVQTLLIEYKSRACGQRILGEGFYWPRNPSGYLQAPLPGAEKLRDILVNKLVHCKSFHIHGSGGTDEYESDRLDPTDAVGIILAIIAETSLAVKSFSVDFNRHGTGWVDAKQLQMPLYHHPQFRKAWAHLEELRLQHTTRSDTFDWAMDLLSHAPSLRKLSLDFDYTFSASFLSRSVSFAHISKGLQDLRLGHAHITVDLLSNLLLKSRDSLRALSFWRIYTEHGSTWVTVFRDLRDKLLHLESISLFGLGGDGSSQIRTPLVMFPTLHADLAVPGSQGRKFQLRYKKWKGEQRVIGASYQGPGMDAALEILAKSVEYM
jgi:hypothetical protein